MKFSSKGKHKDKNKRIVLSFLIFFGLRFVLSIFLGYQYLLFSSETSDTRGGTFVEAIFDHVSYLPYWGVNANDVYYQSLLFSACSTYSGGAYVDQLCSVETEDHRDYYVTVHSGFAWSDGVAMTEDDVFFTYNDIVKNNLWQISSLDVYDVVTVSKKSDGTIKVSFPFVSIDNQNFFTQFILPEHKVKGLTLEQYKTEFALNPVYGGCARIHESAKDESSLVFELGDCAQSNILYYQLKSFASTKDFHQYASNNSNNIISLYADSKELDGFNKYSVLTDKYMTVFFNNESKHLNNSIKRSIGGLISNQFYQTGYDDFFYKDHLLFDTFWSDGSNLEHHIINKNPRLDVNKDGLERININKIPKKILLTGTKQKKVYYLDVMPDTGKFAIYFRPDKKYNRMIVDHEGSTGTVTLPYNESIDRYQYVLELDTNVAEGLNKYSVKGYNKDKIETIADLDIYYLNLPAVDDESREEYIEQKGKIKIIYFEDAASQYVIDTLKQLFSDVSVSQYFHFVGYSSPSEFDTKLLSKDYDVVVSPFDFARKKDFSSFLLTDIPTINPSLYTNQQLAGYISDYVHKSDRIKESLKAQINDIYANDMPFVVLGQIISPHYVQDRYDILSRDELYTIEDFKNSLLQSITIVQHTRLSRSRVLSGAIANEFIQSFFE